jgi:hypothetical protein
VRSWIELLGGQRRRSASRPKCVTNERRHAASSGAAGAAHDLVALGGIREQARRGLLASVSAASTSTPEGCCVV